ncbi:hypothetical protein HME9302_01633 [Alteripontixanthobacter maritimus]|uniref:SURF1-like protein n=1 Tax=Alteripontixanthobacter maritimus TaxID=2161824 RepID=A0A369QB22_9SPHN|nr:SURF1 family protein [Alteripontixanthobacter maritimus]RDC60426.1 hypothetical protein HME9302_01633 [Alteripontixanthobacter maritimus]
MNRLPIIPTIVVAAAVATMIALGFWQLGRADEKEAMIARYEAALVSGAQVPFPAAGGGVAREEDLFHPTTFDCMRVMGREAIAGRSARGQSGLAHIARCETGRGAADVKLGWSRNPVFEGWDGGTVTGLVTAGGRDGARVQLAEPAPGLEPLAVPDPADVPNNHLAYAVQWFLFALTALVIYWLAIRRRHRASREQQ